jgi:hypothetical protein
VTSTHASGADPQSLIQEWFLGLAARSILYDRVV